MWLFPVVGVQIFTVDRDPPLYPEDVLAFLQEVDPNPLLRIPYLEWLLKTDTMPEFHNELANLYLMVITELRAAGART